jgi:hypothetical protein
MVARDAAGNSQLFCLHEFKQCILSFRDIGNSDGNAILQLGAKEQKPFSALFRKMFLVSGSPVSTTGINISRSPSSLHKEKWRENFCQELLQA